jgi:hypothetical protein
MKRWGIALCLIWISQMTAIWTDSQDCPETVEVDSADDYGDVHGSKELTDDPTGLPVKLCYSDECGRDDEDAH